ncbi:MAG: hypothetical protein F4Z29_01890 [Gemmatimonadetes bacterium]|nr:hypothetical protein [Gemmatimonadota bacterium]
MDRQAQAQAKYDAAGATHEDAWDAWNAATDELDKAEALTALEAAERASEDARDALTAANREAARLLQPDYNPNPDTLAIALERARSEHRPHADPAVLELYELAHFTKGPASAEPAAEEPEPEEIAAAEDPQTADPEPLNLEETLAVVAVIQSEIDGLAWTAYDAAWEADEALSSLQAAVDARSAIDAHEKLLDARQRSYDPTQQLRDAVVYWTLRERVEGPYWVHAEAALAAGEMTTEEHEAALVTIQDAISALRTNALSSGIDTRLGQRLAQTALEETANALILADTDGMAAFRMSLTESCQQ